MFRYSVSFLLLLTLVSCGVKKENKELLRSVRYMVVESAASKSRDSFSGFAKASVETRLSFRVSGRIDSIRVNVGSFVSKDEVIATLDPTNYELSVAEAEAAVLEAESQLRKADANYERIRNLYETESASRAELDAAKTTYESAQANVSAREAKLALAKTRLGYTELKAPLDGNIASKKVEINENVVAGQEIVTLNSNDKVKVTLAMPETLIDDVYLDQEVAVRFIAKPGRVYPAKVTEIGVASRTYTTYPVTVELVKQVSGIRSGMTSEVFFPFQRGDQTITLPANTLQDDGDKQYVFLLEATEDPLVFIAKKQEVQVVDLTDEGVVIGGGLQPKDRIVKAGLLSIEEGQKVRLAE